jgi:rhodanese-related sulfurtransferase
MYIEFMTEYWYLFATLFVIVLLLSFDPGTRNVGGSKSVTPGHISQAINIPIGGFSDSIGKLKKHQKKTIVVTCDTGTNSRKAVPILQKNEYSDIYVLTGGLAAWKKENLPLEKS